jgi:hypothetical protein
MRLDDFDVFSSIKVWMHNEDKILACLCTSLINRHLYKVLIQNIPFDRSFIEAIRSEVLKKFDLSEDESGYFIIEDIVTNSAYSLNDDKIKIMFRDGTLMDVSEASDQLNISVLSSEVSKYVLCYPKSITIS